jgi:ribosome-associated heat shock protein Hsp15
MATQEPPDTQRLDKWLWCARFFRTRAMAAAICAQGRVRVSGQVVHKAHYTLRPGDVLTFPQGNQVRVVRVAGFAERRGPASAAAALYEDLAPPQARDGTEEAPPRA